MFLLHGGCAEVCVGERGGGFVFNGDSVGVASNVGLLGGGILFFVWDPIGVASNVGVAICLHSISWMDKSILTKLTQTNFWIGLVKILQETALKMYDS